MASMGPEQTCFIQMNPTIRRRLEATLDNLVGLLDALDGDPDLEFEAELAFCTDEAEFELSLQRAHSRGGNGDIVELFGRAAR
jgi:hypothetical protein